MNSSLQRIRVVIVLLCLFAVLNAEARNPSQFKNWNPPSNEVRVKPKLNCPDLRSLTGYEFSVTASAIAGTADVPEHCLVSGQILPEIRFEVDLPAAWNRRLYMFGNGGYGQAESHAYFGGCSKGGSQALISAQRFPKDFDGVIVGDPMIDYVGSNISSVWKIRAAKAG